jgi:microsomal prostaglandin-E synthase 1
MLTLASDPRFRTYALCCVVLSLQMLILAGVTAARRSKHQGYANPEDERVAFKGAKLVEGAEHPDVARVQRAHRNLLESLPMFFALGLVYVLAGASPLGAQICFFGFTGARILHSLVYINAMQPWRTATYAIGSFALVGMSVLTLLALYT